MKVHNSALRHGIVRGDAIRVAQYPLWVDFLDEESPSRQLRLGFDTKGRMLETVVLVFDSGDELIIHAMKIRASVLELIPPELLNREY